jgi:hypothetical protein
MRALWPSDLWWAWSCPARTHRVQPAGKATLLDRLPTSRADLARRLIACDRPSNRVAVQPRAAMELPDRQATHEPKPPSLRPLLHSHHRARRTPTPPSARGRGSADHGRRSGGPDFNRRRWSSLTRRRHGPCRLAGPVGSRLAAAPQSSGRIGMSGSAVARVHAKCLLKSPAEPGSRRRPGTGWRRSDPPRGSGARDRT